MKIFFWKCHILLHLDVILVLFLVNNNILFFSNLIIFVACSFKELHKFFIQSSPGYKLCLFSALSKVHIVDIVYSQGISSLVFVVEYFSGLFGHLSIFEQRFKVNMNNVWHFIWLHTLIKRYYIILFKWHYNSTKIAIFTYLFLKI